MPETERKSTRKWRFPPELGTFLTLLGVYLLFVLLCRYKGEAAFVSFVNLKGIMGHTVIVGIGALGMTLIIISGSIDLSAGSVIALVTCVMGVTLRRWGDTDPGLSLPLLAALGGILAGGLCGLANGVLVSRLRLIPFIATLGMMQVARGVAKWLGGNQTIVTPPNWFQKMMYLEPGRISPALRWLVFSPGVWLTVLLLVAVHVLLRYTVFGRHVYAIGSNEDTARLCGVNVARTKTLVFVLGGLFLGVAGSMQYAMVGVGDPTGAFGMELDIIAAVVIGGGSLNGGQGSAIRAILGALITSVLRNGPTKMGRENYVQDINVGLVNVGATSPDRHQGPRRQ